MQKNTTSALNDSSSHTNGSTSHDDDTEEQMGEKDTVVVYDLKKALSPDQLESYKALTGTKIEGKLCEVEDCKKQAFF